MSDLATLEKKILGEIAAAGDEGALEAVRVAALGSLVDFLVLGVGRHTAFDARHD